MKNNQLTTVLMGLTAFCAVATLALFYMANRNTSNLRSMQGQLAGINNNRAIATGLLNELSEYSKRNPSIQPILQTVIAKPAAPQPAAK